MSDRIEKARRYHEEIRRILLHDWDPIGISDVPEAQDEYDSYVGGVYRLLISRATPQQIFDVLWDIETNRMGLCGNRNRTDQISQQLHRLIETIESYA
jgi:hypothetical protein